MNYSLKHWHRKVFVLSLFLVIVAIVACQDKHIFRWGATSPSPFGSTFLVIGDSRSGNSIYTDQIALKNPRHPRYPCAIALFSFPAFLVTFQRGDQARDILLLGQVNGLEMFQFF